MESFAKRFVLSYLLVFGLFCVESEGMQRSKSSSDILSQHQATLVAHKRGSSDPVTMKEKVICSARDFQELTLDEAKRLKSVTFRGMKINEEFVEKFWSIFGGDVVIESLSFDHCLPSNGFSFSDIIAGGCPSSSLKITSCGITVDEASDILLQANPYSVRSIDFSGNKFKKRDSNFQEMLRLRVYDRMCLDRMDLCVN